MIRNEGKQKTMSQIKIIIPILIGALIYLLPSPMGLDLKGWHMFAIFLATIIGIILKSMPMGAVALFGMLAACLTGILDINKEAITAFGSNTIWLVVLVFFIARGFIKTNLASRIAYQFVSLLGKRSLGLGYGIILSELLMAPFIPSNTARAGGVIFPITKSISEALGSSPAAGTERDLGSYLIQVAYHGNLITSAMFLTAMAANPMAQAFAAKLGVQISWIEWARAALMPGLASIVIVPFLLYVVYPPKIKELPEAKIWANKKLLDLGSMSSKEWIMTMTFAVMIIFWAIGDRFGIAPSLVALFGLCTLLFFDILTMEDILKETESWHTLLWLSILVMMAGCLDKFGFITWFSSQITYSIAGLSWPVALLTLVLVYFYSHYFFAGNAAHVGAMYTAFLSVAISIGSPPLMSALILGFFSSLFSSMTHYATAPASVLFGSGYVPIGEWWFYGLIVGTANVIVWLFIGAIWWKILGLW